MFWMMNGRNRRGMGGGLFLLPGILFGGFFGIYAILAVLNVAGVVIGAVFSGLAAAISGVIFSGAVNGIGSVGGLIAGIAIGVALYFHIRRRRNGTAEEE